MPDPILLNLDLSSTGNITAVRYFGDGSGLTNITTTNLPTPRTIAATGDATWSVSFDGTQNVSGTLTLANSGVTAGTYTKLTVDAKGRVTAGASLTSGDLPAHTHAITDIVNNGILVKTTDTGTVTNTMLAGSIANSKLVNSSITLNGVSVSLGGTATIPSSTSGTLTIGSYLTGGSFNGSSNVTIAADASTTNTASKLVARDASGNFSAGIITASLNGLANNISQYVVNQDVGTTSTPTFGTVYAGNVQATGAAPALDIRRNATANMGALRYYNNQLAKYDWTVYPEANVTNADLIFGATSQVAMRVSQTGLLTVNGGIANVRLPRNSVYSNLTSPSVEEIAIFPQQMANKIRFQAPYLQEESTDGTTWTTSTRASAQQLVDMTVGEGQTLGNPINIIPVTAVGDSGYYRLTWDSQTGGYRYLNSVYAYMVTAGAWINIKIEAYSNTTSSWVQLTTGSANGWPAHVYIPHDPIPVDVQVVAGFYRYFRITFHLAAALYSNYNIQLYALEWAGGYPASLRRNIHRFDSSQNVYWPAGVYGTKFVDSDSTNFYLDPSSGTSLVVAGSTTQGGNSQVANPAAGATGYTVTNTVSTGTPGILFYENVSEYASIRRNNSGVANPGRVVYTAIGTGASHYFNTNTTVAGNLTVTGSTTLSGSLTVPGIVSTSGLSETSAIDGALELTSSDDNWKYISFKWSGGRKSYFGISPTGLPIWGSDVSGSTFTVTSDGTPQLYVASGYLQANGFYAGNATAGAGSFGGSVTHGASIKGSGTTSDVTIYNKSGTVVLTVPTGTTNATIAGTLTASNVTATNFLGRADKAKAIDIGATPPALSASAAPRLRGGAGSVYLYDNYDFNNFDGSTPNWPVQYGTIMEIYGRDGHQIDQLHFGYDRKIHHRTAFYNETTWSAFQKILTSDEASVGNTANKVVLRDASGNFSAGTITANLLGSATNVTGTVAIANGGTGATTAAGARTNLGATTTGSNLFTLTDPSAIRFIRVNADNTVSALSAEDFRTAIGAGSGGGSVSSVSGTGTVNGITLTGTVTSTGSLTLGGALTGVNLTSQVTGILPVANGGTGATGRQAANTSVANWGQLHPHTTFTDFNSVPNTWGFSHVFGGTGTPAANSPHTNSTQWYRARISLGSPYDDIGNSAAAYWMEFAMPRYSGSSYGNLYFRTMEAGTVSNWYGVRAAYSESAGSAGLVTDGVYLSTDQTISGQKTFSKDILSTVGHLVSQDRFLQFLSDNGASTYGVNYGYALSSVGDPYGRIRRRHAGVLSDVITFRTDTGNVVIHSATNATDKDTAALVIEGGIGVEKDVVVGGAVYAQTYANAKGQQVQFSGRGLNGGWTAGIHFHHANTNNSATFVHHPGGDLLLYTTASTANYTDGANLALKVETSRNVTFYADARINGSSTVIGNSYIGASDTYLYRNGAGTVAVAGGNANRLDVTGSTSAGVGFRQTGSRDFFISAESSELRVYGLTAGSPFVVNSGTPMRIRDTTAADATLTAGALVVSGGMAVVSSVYTGGTYFATANTNAIASGLSITNSNTGDAVRSRLSLTAGTSVVTFEAYGSGHSTRSNQTILASSNGSISFSPSGVETIKAAFDKVEILANTSSGASNSGALVVTGGVGIGGAVNTAGAITAAGQIKTSKTSAGTIDIIAEHAGTATDARARVVAMNNNGYQIGFTFQGTNFTQNGPFRTNRGAIVGSFDISYLSGQHLFWEGIGGDGTSPTGATLMLALVGVNKQAALYFDTESNDFLSGALTVAGGVGIAKNLNVRGSTNNFGNTGTDSSVYINSNNISRLSLKDSGGSPREYFIQTSGDSFQVVDNTASALTIMSLAPNTGNAIFAGTVSSGGYIYPGNDSNFYIRGTQSGNGLIRGNTLSMDAAVTFLVRNGSSTGNFFEVSTSTGSTTSGTMIGGKFVISGGTETYAYYDQSNGAFYHSPGAMVRKDSAVTDPGEMPGTLVLYNRNGTALNGSKLVFAANETTESGANPVALAAIVGQKASGVAGNWAHGRLRFYVKAGGMYNEVLTFDSAKNAAFTGPIIMPGNVAQYWTDSSGSIRRSVLLTSGNDYYFGPTDAGWNAALTHVRAGTSMYLGVNGSSGTFTNAVVINSTGTVTLAKDPASDRDATTRVWAVSRGENLITNGSGLMASNYNFSGFTFDATQTHGGGGSFMTAASYSSFISDEFVPVDPEKNYRMVVWARSGQDGGVDYTAANSQYAGIVVYDIDGQSIQPFNYAKYPGSTDTTLTATLNVGDTSFTVANAAGWAAAGTENYMRTLAWYGYTNAKGYTYPNYTYTRNVSWYQSSTYQSSGTWGTNGISGNTITLTAPWPGPSIPAGTAVRNSTSGGTYKYIVFGAAAIPNSWSRYEGFIGGLDTTGSQNANKFPYGTSFIKLLFLTNYHAASGTPSGNKIRYSDITFSESSSANLEAATASTPGVVSTTAQSFSGEKTFLTSVYTPIVYDNDNTAYYSNPAGTSNFATLAVTGKVVVNGSPAGSGNGDVGASRSSTTGAYYLGTDGQGYLYRESLDTMVLRANTATTLKLGATGAAYTHYIRGATAGGAIQFKCDPLTADRYLSLGSVNNLTEYSEALRLTGTAASFTGTATVAGLMTLNYGANIAGTDGLSLQTSGSASIRYQDSGVSKWWIYKLNGDSLLYFRDMVNSRMQMSMSPGATSNNAATFLYSTLSIDASTVSNSNNSGALVVSGGAGIGGALNVGGTLTTNGATKIGTSAASAGLFVQSQAAAFQTGNQLLLDFDQINGYARIQSHNGTSALPLRLQNFGGDTIIGGNVSVGSTATVADYTAAVESAAGGAPRFRLHQSGVRGWNIINRATSGTLAFNDGAADWLKIEHTTGATTVSSNLTVTGNLTAGGNNAVNIIQGGDSGSGTSMLVLRSYGGTTKVVFRGDGDVNILNGTTSNSTSSGALIVNGGVGIAGALNLGENLRVSGLVGVGTAPDASIGINNQPTLSSGNFQYGVYSVPTFNSTTHDSGFFSLRTAASVAASSAYALRAYTPTLGSGSTISTITGLRIENFGVAGITNAYGIDIAAQSGAATTNVGLRNAGTTRLTNNTNSGSKITGSVVIGDGTNGGLGVSKDIFVGGTGIFGDYVGGAYTAGDIIVRRSATTGAIRFGDSSGTYLYFDGGNYVFGGTPGLDVGGQITGKTGGVFYRGTNNSGSTLLALKRADGTTNLLTATDSADGLTLKLGYTGLGNTTNWVSLYGNGNDGAGLQINSSQTAAAGQIVFSNEAKARWRIQRDPSVTEAGSNVGSDLNISAYNDAGTSVLSTPLAISRATGITTLTGLSVTGTVNITGSNKLTFSSFSDANLYRLNSGIVGTDNTLQAKTGIVIDADTGNANSTLTMTARSAGSALTSSIQVNQSGNVTWSLSGTDRTYTLPSLVRLTNNSASNDAASGALVVSGGVGITGAINATGNITAYYSDERLKTRLGKIENAIEKVQSLSGFYFAPNDTAMALGYQKKIDVGVSAQEVKEILPEIIAPAPIDPQYMTVRYEKLIPLLIEAIKEQQSQIETLKQMVATLTAK